MSENLMTSTGMEEESTPSTSKTSNSVKKTPVKRSAEISSKERKKAEDGRNKPNSPEEPSVKRQKPESSSERKLISRVVKLDPDEDAEDQYSLAAPGEITYLSTPTYEPYDSDTSEDPEERHLNVPAKLSEIVDHPPDAASAPPSPPLPSGPVNISLHVSKSCRIGPLFDEVRLRSLPPHKPLPYPEEITRIVQNLIRCAHRPRDIFNSLKDDVSGQPFSIVMFFHRANGKLECKNIPVSDSDISARAWLSEFLESVGCCKNLFALHFIPDDFICTHCFTKNQEEKGTDESEEMRERPEKRRREDEEKRKEALELKRVEEETRKEAEDERKRKEREEMQKKKRQQEEERSRIEEEARNAAEEPGEDVNDLHGLDPPIVKRKKPEAPSASIATSPLFLIGVVNVAFQVSPHCRIGPILDKNRMLALPPYNSLPYPDQYTRVVQDLIRYAHRPEVVFNSVKDAADGEPSTVVTCYNEAKRNFDTKNIPVVGDINSAQTWLSELLESIDCCRNLFLTDFIAEQFVCKECFTLNQEHLSGTGTPRQEMATQTDVSQEEEKSNEVDSERVEEQMREKTDAEKIMTPEEIYNSIHAFFLYHLPQGCALPRPDLETLVLNCPALTSMEKVRVRVYIEGGKEVWQLANETPMYSEILKEITVHRCSTEPEKGDINCNGSMLEMWLCILLHCPKCIKDNSLEKALEKVKKFIEAECLKEEERKRQVEEEKRKAADEEMLAQEEMHATMNQRDDELRRREADLDRREEELKKEQQNLQQEKDEERKRKEKEEKRKGAEEERLRMEDMHAEVKLKEEELKKREAELERKEEELQKVQQQHEEEMLRVNLREVEEANKKKEAERKLMEEEERRRIEDELRKVEEKRLRKEERKRMRAEKKQKMLEWREEEKKKDQKLRKKMTEQEKSNRRKEKLQLLENEWKKLELMKHNGEMKLMRKEQKEKYLEEMQRMELTENEIRTAMEKLEKEELESRMDVKLGCKNTVELRKKLIGSWSGSGSTKEEHAKDCYLNINSIFLTLFKIPEQRTDLRPDLENMIASECPGVSFDHFVRVNVYLDDDDREMWQLGNEKYIDSSVLKEITTHSCSSVFTDLTTGGTLLELWHSLLLHCPRCIRTNPSTWTPLINRIRNFIQSEEQERWKMAQSKDLD